MNWNEIELPDKNIYFQDEAVVIYNADCREVLPLIPDKSIDLVLTDPPYGNTTKDYDDIPDYWNWYNSIFLLIDIVAKDDSSLLVESSLKTLYESMSILRQYFTYKYPFGYHILNREKRGLCPLGFATFSLYLWYSKGNAKLQKRHRDFIMLNNENPISNHPSSKPTNLYNLLLSMFSKQTDIILDPFLGSGTTAYCAKKLGRKCIGIEINSDYCHIAADRLRQTILPLEMEQVQQGQSISESLMFNGMTSPTKGNKIARKVGIHNTRKEANG